MLSGIRARGASLCEASLSPPWTLRCADGASLTMVTVLDGGASLLPSGGPTLTVGPGDTALVRGPAPFRLVDASKERTSLVMGGYQSARGRHDRLLDTLPPALVHREESDDVLWLASARDALERRDRPGGQALVDRALDMGLVCTLGCWFEREGANAPAWYRGTRDPVVGPALDAIHEHLDQAWTVGSLAARAGVSRAHFATRFTEVMGQTPLGYLTEWRMYTAEELLAEPDAGVARVADAVGYSDAAAFSTAFKRLRGMSPREFRRRATAVVPGSG